MDLVEDPTARGSTIIIAPYVVIHEIMIYYCFYNNYNIIKSDDIALGYNYR